MEQTQSEPFKGWCILELMGHRRLAGFVSEQVIAGQAFLRIDIPDVAVDNTPAVDSTATSENNKPVVSQFYSPASVYCLTPVDEKIARLVAKSCQPEPVHQWEVRSLMPSGMANEPEDDDEEGDTLRFEEQDKW